MSEGFTKGVARHVLAVLKDTLVATSAARSVRATGWPSSWTDRMKPLAEVRLYVKFVKEYMNYVFVHESLQEALAPFDLEGFAHVDASDEKRILEQYFKPLAALRGADLASTVAEYVRVRPLAQQIRKRGVTEVSAYWGMALKERDAYTKLPNL